MWKSLLAHLPSASPYIVVYDDSDGAFYLLNQIGGTPVGSMVANAGTVLPAGWLWCDGSAVSRTTFARLFAVISTQWGAGDTTTTFNLPDMSGILFLCRQCHDTLNRRHADRSISFRQWEHCRIPIPVNWMIKY